MKHLGPLYHFLGIEVLKHSTDLFLSQSKYAKDLLSCTNMLGCKLYGSPWNYKGVVTDDVSNFVVIPSFYLSITRALQYLTITRPNLSFVVNQAS